LRFGREETSEPNPGRTRDAELKRRSCIVLMLRVYPTFPKKNFLQQG
jgi:hypothetical protein